MFKVEFTTGGSAFRDEDGYDSSNHEVRRILRVISEKLENGYTKDIIMDINGNKVGEWKLDV